MSIGRRIRDGVNSLMDSLAADDEPLSHVEEAALRAEIEARQADSASARPPRDNPRAKHAGGSDRDREARRKAADIREARIHRVRDQREAKAKAARDAAFRQAKEQARRSGTSSRSSTSSSSRSRSSGPRRPFGPKNDKIAGFYRQLDLPVGAPFAEVKKQYRVLMRKYHPDRHVGDPKKQKAATELTMRVTQAYNELEIYLVGGPNKG